METADTKRTAHGAQHVFLYGHFQVHRNMQSTCHITQTDHGRIVRHCSAYLHARITPAHSQAPDTGIFKIFFNDLGVMLRIRVRRSDHQGQGEQEDCHQHQKQGPPAGSTGGGRFRDIRQQCFRSFGVHAKIIGGRQQLRCLRDRRYGSRLHRRSLAGPGGAGGLIFLFALIPGFPKPQLFTLAFAIAGLGYILDRIRSAPAPRDARKELGQSLKSAARKERKGRPSGPQDDFAPTVPIILDISEGLAASLDYDSLNDELSALRRALYFDLGVPFPGINLRISSTLSGLAYELQVNEIPMSRGHLEQGMVLARESEDTLRMLGLEVKRGENFLPDVESLWIPAEKQALLEQAGLSCMTHSRILAYHLSLILARHASSFIGMQETKYLLDRMEERAPDLVREATRLLPVQRIAEIFQRLAQEQVSIRDLRNILEAIIEWSPKEKDTVMLTEYVRGALKRQISYMYSRGQNMLPAILMDPSVEETIRKAIRQTSAGAFLALDPDTSRRFIAAVGAAAGDYRKHVQMPVLLASMDIRRYVRRLIEAEHYRLPVVSYQELTPEISVQPMNRIRL